MSHTIGENYHLQLSAEWLRYESERPWHGKTVKLVKLIKSIQEVSNDTQYGPALTEHTHAVACSGLTTAYIDNVFLAKPEWLLPLSQGADGPEKEPYISPFTGKSA